MDVPELFAPLHRWSLRTYRSPVDIDINPPKVNQKVSLDLDTEDYHSPTNYATEPGLISFERVKMTYKDGTNLIIAALLVCACLVVFKIVFKILDPCMYCM